jgi:hypothetical protein
MTDDELRAYAKEIRPNALREGSMSPSWDIIADIEAILDGRPSILDREEMEKMIARLRS